MRRMSNRKRRMNRSRERRKRSLRTYGAGAGMDEDAKIMYILKFKTTKGQREVNKKRASMRAEEQ